MDLPQMSPHKNFRNQPRTKACRRSRQIDAASTFSSTSSSSDASAISSSNRSNSRSHNRRQRKNRHSKFGHLNWKEQAIQAAGEFRRELRMQSFFRRRRIEFESTSNALTSSDTDVSLISTLQQSPSDLTTVFEYFTNDFPRQKWKPRN